MFPMIATVDEFRAARELVDVECDWARRRGRPLPSLLRVGAMIECPSLLWHLDALLPLTDFVSIGTNDLLQYMFAADRTNPLVSDRYDPLSPPALRALAEIQQKCADSATPVLGLRRTGRASAGSLRPDHPGLHPSVGARRRGWGSGRTWAAPPETMASMWRRPSKASSAYRTGPL